MQVAGGPGSLFKLDAHTRCSLSGNVDYLSRGFVESKATSGRRQGPQVVLRVI